MTYNVFGWTLTLTQQQQ